MAVTEVISLSLSVFCRVINLENGLTALLISDTKSVTHCTSDSDMSVTDEDDDTCSEELDEGSDSDDYDDSDGDNDHIDGALVCSPEREQDSDAEQSRKSKDTKLVSICFWLLDAIYASYGNSEKIRAPDGLGFFPSSHKIRAGNLAHPNV